MIVNTSAAVAIILREPNFEALVRRLVMETEVGMGTPSLAERLPPDGPLESLKARPRVGGRAFDPRETTSVSASGPRRSALR